MSNQDVINAIEQDYRLPPPMDCPSALHQLMLDCWQKDPQRSASLRRHRQHSGQDDTQPHLPEDHGQHPCHPLPASPGPLPPRLQQLRLCEEWLAAIKMTQYRDNFLNSGFTSLQLVTQMTSE
ncbi:ephrin type-B receptor 1-A-like [Osmerus eperlanus]|uniref:ephrin type-B receptor 1-A-like n=1 Tax=Osmerus eperlanus TaxID=29151 RepID=UPI002E11633D